MLKKCSTSVQLDRVAFFRSDFFQNRYFRQPHNNLIVFGFVVSIERNYEMQWKRKITTMDGIRRNFFETNPLCLVAFYCELSAIIYYKLFSFIMGTDSHTTMKYFENHFWIS